MIAKLRVAYFTTVGLTPVGKNGGSMCCRNHLSRIANDPDVDCVAYLAGPSFNEVPSLEYAKTVVRDAHYFPFNDKALGPTNSLVGLSWAGKKWPFWQELEAISQQDIGVRLAEALLRDRPDVLVVDYLYSALYVRDLYALGLPVVLITLNREADFYRDMRWRGVHFYDQPASRVAEWRLRRFEAQAYRKSAAVVAIGRHDVPRAARRRAHWISPFLDRSDQRWSFNNSRSLFFIGAHHHYPNHQAIEWLATRFCPELALQAPDLSVNVLGMSDDEAPSDWHRSNIYFNGYGNDGIAESAFLSEGALIAPIENDFGAKFKILEALSHGTPFLANRAAMSGISFLPNICPIDLNDPKGAAVAATELLCSPGEAEKMHGDIGQGLDAHAMSQNDVWGKLLRSVI